MVIAVVRGGFNLVQQVQRKGSHCAWERGHRALGDATRTETPARRPGSREPGRPQGLPLSSVEFLQFQPSVGDPMRLPLSSVEFLGEMSDVLHSYAPLPLIPPAPFSHQGRRGSLAF